MQAILRTLYKKPENVPSEVCEFINQLYKANPPKNIGPTESLAMAQRYAGLSDEILSGYQYLKRHGCIR